MFWKPFTLKHLENPENIFIPGGIKLYRNPLLSSTVLLTQPLGENTPSKPATEYTMSVTYGTRLLLSPAPLPHITQPSANIQTVQTLAPYIVQTCHTLDILLLEEALSIIGEVRPCVYFSRGLLLHPHTTTTTPTQPTNHALGDVLT